MGSSTCGLGTYQFLHHSEDTTPENLGGTIQYIWTDFEITRSVVIGINKVSRKIEGVAGCKASDTPTTGATLEVILDPGVDRTIAQHLMKAYAQYLDDLNQGRVLPLDVESAMAVHSHVPAHTS